MSKPTLVNVSTKAREKWRSGRRAFDARALSERRLLTMALLALIVFLSDALWLTPTFERLKAIQKRQSVAIQTRDALQADATRRLGDRERRQTEARLEIKRLQDMFDQDREVLEQQQQLLAPAREMRGLLEGLLEENARLKIKGIRTLAPQEVKVPSTVELGLAPVLYRHTMEIILQGSYNEMVRWLHRVETQPSRVLWDQAQLTADDPSGLTLALTVHTFSPDKDALEIAP